VKRKQERGAKEKKGVYGAAEGDRSGWKNSSFSQVLVHGLASLGVGGKREKGVERWPKLRQEVFCHCNLQLAVMKTRKKK